MVTLDRYLRDLPPNEGGPITNNNVTTGCGRGNATLIVFIEHLIQSSIPSNYSINVFSGDLYQGDPDLYWSFNLVDDL